MRLAGVGPRQRAVKAMELLEADAAVDERGAAISVSPVPPGGSATTRAAAATKRGA